LKLSLKVILFLKQREVGEKPVSEEDRRARGTEKKEKGEPLCLRLANYFLLNFLNQFLLKSSGEAFQRSRKG